MERAHLLFMSINGQEVKDICKNDGCSVMYIISLSENTEGKLECKCGIFVVNSEADLILYHIQFLEFTLENNVK